MKEGKKLRRPGESLLAFTAVCQGEKMLMRILRGDTGLTGLQDSLLFLPRIVSHPAGPPAPNPHPHPLPAVPQWRRRAAGTEG